MPTNTVRDGQASTNLLIVFDSPFSTGQYQIRDNTSLTYITTQTEMVIHQGTELVQINSGTITFLTPGVYNYHISIPGYTPNQFSGLLLISLDPSNTSSSVVRFNVGVDTGYYANYLLPWIVLIAGLVFIFALIYFIIVYVDGRKPILETGAGLAYTLVSIGSTFWFLSKMPTYSY